MGKPQEPSSFDYKVLEEATRAFVHDKADETRGLLKRTAQNILAIGSNLRAVKERLPHGQFLAWLHSEFAMTERHARNFMQVAARFGDKSEIISDLSVTVIYALAAPATSEAVISQVERGEIPATVSAIREAREAEQQARAEAERAQHTIRSLQEELHQQEVTIAHLTRDRETLQQHQQHVTELSHQSPQGQEKATPDPSSAVTEEIETLRQHIVRLTEERTILVGQVKRLQEEEKAAAVRQEAHQQERQIRLRWFRSTNAFQAALQALLSEWPSPVDTHAFETEDWNRLAHVKALALRFLAECDTLSGGSAGIVVDSTSVTSEK